MRDFQKLPLGCAEHAPEPRVCGLLRQACLPLPTCAERRAAIASLGSLHGGQRDATSGRHACTVPGNDSVTLPC